MTRFVLLCFLLFAFKEAQGQTTEVTKCLKSNGVLPINAHVVGCIEPPCILPQLEDVVINVVFEAPYLLYNLTTKALAIVKLGILPIEINYDLGDNAVTCDFFTNTYCPILPKEVVQYTLNMYIESFFPAGTSATIEFRVEDEDKKSIWCIRLAIKITEPRRSITGGYKSRRLNGTTLR